MATYTPFRNTMLPRPGSAAAGVVAGTVATALAVGGMQRMSLPEFGRPLTPTQMERVIGGQEPYWIEVSCDLVEVAALSSWYFGFTVPALVPAGVGCGVIDVTATYFEAVESNYNTTQQAIATWLYNTYNWDDYHHLSNVDGVWGSWSNGMPTYHMTVEGVLAEWYCGGYQCMCDFSWDCASSYCVGGYCS